MRATLAVVPPRHGVISLPFAKADRKVAPTRTSRSSLPRILLDPYLPDPYPAPPAKCSPACLRRTKADPATGLLYLPRFLAKCRYVKAHGALPASYAKNYKRGLDRFLCLPRRRSRRPVEKSCTNRSSENEVRAKLKSLFPTDVRVQMEPRTGAERAEAGQEFMAAALTAMGCADRIGQIRSVPDLIDFDETD